MLLTEHTSLTHLEFVSARGGNASRHISDPTILLAMAFANEVMDAFFMHWCGVCAYAFADKRMNNAHKHRLRREGGAERDMDIGLLEHTINL